MCLANGINKENNNEGLMTALIRSYSPTIPMFKIAGSLFKIPIELFEPDEILRSSSGEEQGLFRTHVTPCATTVASVAASLGKDLTKLTQHKILMLHQGMNDVLSDLQLQFNNHLVCTPYVSLSSTKIPYTHSKVPAT